MFPDIYDCHAFFVCDDYNSVPTYWHCTNNLYYNYLTGTCDLTSTCSWVITASTATTPATTTTAAEPSAVPICTRPAELFPDIYDCQAFFACDDYLVPIHWQCANNLSYDHLTNSCAETSTCAWTVPTSVATTTTEPSAIPTCTKPAEMFPDIYDCQAFYICDDKLVPILWHCTNNLYYNAQTEVCDIESSCSWTVPTTATTTTTTITGPRAVPTCTNDGQVFPELYDCNAFFICDKELIPKIMYCSKNLYYSVETESCETTSSCSWIVPTTNSTQR